MPPTPAPPTTLRALAAALEEQLTQQRTAALERLADAQTAVATAESDHAAALADVAERDAAEAEVRARMAAAPTRADAEDLLDDVEAAMMAGRAARAAALAAESEVEAARQEATAAQELVTSVDADLARATAATATAKEEDDTRTRLKNAIGAAPLAGVRQEANDAKTSATAVAAKTRVEENMPADLLARARDRFTKERDAAKRRRDAATAARTTLNDTLAADLGKEGELAGRWAAFRAAEERLRAYATSAPADVRRAVSLLEEAAASPQLTAVQRGRANDDDLEPGREEAVTKEKARDDARADLEVKEIAYQNARLAALAQDPEADPDEDPTVEPKLTERNEARDEYDDKEGELTQALRTTLDEWEATVPDTRWRALAAYETARATLDDLSALDPTTLRTSFVNAERDLAGKLAEDAKRKRARRIVAAEVQARAAAVAAADRLESARRFAALRGDA